MKVSLVKERDQLTKSENKICDYIEEYMNNSIYMTVTEIANGCGVGEATVTRFCRKLGFRSFLEFKMTMAQELKNGSVNKELFEEENLKDDSVESLSKNIYEANVKLLENCFKSIDYKKIDEITDEIIKARRIYFAGIGHSGVIAENIYYKLMRLGIDCNCYKDTHTIVMMSSIMKEGDVLFVVSNTGSTSEINTAVELAQRNGVKVVAVTGNLMSKLSRTSDYTITYAASESMFESAIAGSEIQQTYIIDLLYNNVLRKNSEYTIKNKNKTTDAVGLLGSSAD